MTTRGGPVRSPPVISLVASRPSISGIRTSIRITSGLCSAAAWTAWAPLAASATTVIPSVASRITQNPVLTSSWSSATMTRMGSAPVMGRSWGRSWRGQPGRDGEPAGVARSDGQAAPAGRHPLGDAGQAESARYRRAGSAPVGRARPAWRGLASEGRGGPAPGIGHRHGDVARLIADGDRGLARAGMLDRVGQRLLHDPVSGQAHAGWQLARAALDAQVHGDPGLAHLPEYLAELADRRGRGRGRPAVDVGRAAQHAEEAAQLGQGLPGRLA